jgi:hypothetical protein
MKKILLIVVHLMIFPFFPAFASVSLPPSQFEQINANATYSIISSVEHYPSEDATPYAIRFVVKFEKPTKNPAACWKYEKRDELLLEGISIIGKNEGANDEYLFIIDMEKIKKITGSLGTPIKFYVGCDKGNGDFYLQEILIQKTRVLQQKDPENPVLEVIMTNDIYQISP